MSVEMPDLLQLVVNEGVSDLHIEVGAPPMVRLHGDLTPLNVPALTPEDTERLVKSIASDDHMQCIAENGAVDFGFAFGDQARFRVSAFKQKGSFGTVLRQIPNTLLTLEQIGLPNSIKNLLYEPRGLILVTGPTGSGKSTTLASMLNIINEERACHIITVEDPVEYEVAGINQVQVRADVGMTFSAALRAMLRQAPNIVMVGEIRDLETAEIAINASLTGHMVFSTLHTNDAPSAVSRLIDMGVKPFLVSASLRAALAQRLVRSICQNCKQPYVPTPSELSVLGVGDEQASSASFMHGAGCEKCGDNGFRGRKGVFEIFSVNQEIEEMIYHNVSIVELRKKAREMGMRSMREDGFRKVLAGITTLDEVLMVTTAEE